MTTIGHQDRTASWITPVGPRLHHLSSLDTMRRAVVRAPVRIAHRVCERVLDQIGARGEHFDEDQPSSDPHEARRTYSGHQDALAQPGATIVQRPGPSDSPSNYSPERSEKARGAA